MNVQDINIIWVLPANCAREGGFMSHVDHNQDCHFGCVPPVIFVPLFLFVAGQATRGTCYGICRRTDRVESFLAGEVDSLCPSIVQYGKPETEHHHVKRAKDE